MTKFSTSPLYLQVRDNIAERIAAHNWQPNSAIPNETDLAREMGVSPGTMRKALDMLEFEGLVTRKQGRGTYINDLMSPALASKHSNFRSNKGERQNGDIEMLSVVEGAATDAERKRLQLGEQDQVCHVERIRSHMGQRFLFETVSFPASVFPGLAEGSLASSSLATIANAYRVLLGKGVETVSPRVASPSALGALEIAEGTPVLVLDRLISARNGRPLEWRIAESCGASGLEYVVVS